MKKLLVLLLLAPFALSAQIISTVAGTGSGSYSGNGIPAISAGMPVPGGGAFDIYGNYYFADGLSSHRVRKIDVYDIITTVAGNGTGGYGMDSVAATATSLSQPQEVALDTLGNMYIADLGNHRIRKVNAVTGMITTYAGTGTGGFSGDSGQATAAKIWSPQSLCIDKFENIYIADFTNRRIRKVTPAGIITTFAGPGSSSSLGDGGPATAAFINGILGLAADDTGNIYIADASSCRVRKVNRAGIITTVVGNGNCVYAGDSVAATNAQIQPRKIYLDHVGNMFITDKYNVRVYKVDTLGILHWIAGNGSTGAYSGDGGLATAATMDYPSGAVTDACGNLYIPTVNNHRIRKVTYYTAAPTIVLAGRTSSAIGSSVTIVATVTGAGANYPIRWYNHGILFATTTIQTVTYTKALCRDSITAVAFGCSDSATSTVHVVGCSVGINESGAGNGSSITLWPNPVNGTLHISGLSPDGSTITLYDLLGRELLRSEFAGSAGEVNLSGLVSGVYLVQVCDVGSGVRVVRRVRVE